MKMRLINADKFKQEIAAATIRNNLAVSKCNAICELIDRQPTAYDVDRVVEGVNSIGKSYCDSIKCDKNCQDCDHGSIMRAITQKVKAGGANE